MKCQPSFNFAKIYRLSHGDEKSWGKRKVIRPMDPRKPLHLILKSSRAQGAWSLLSPHFKGQISFILYAQAQRWKIELLSYSNVGNHLHLLVRFSTRKSLQTFLRVVAGRIAMLITKARKGFSVGRFWDKAVFSRVVQWGRDFEGISTYLVKNFVEPLGFRHRVRSVDQILQAMTPLG